MFVDHGACDKEVTVLLLYKMFNQLFIFNHISL